MATNLTLPTPPFIHAPGIENLRDAGGYPVESQNGKAVRRGILFRAADPTHLNEEGVAILQRLGITHIFDLRSLVELAKGREQPREWKGARRVPTPVFLDKDYSPEALALRLRNYSIGTEVSQCYDAAHFTANGGLSPPPLSFHYRRSRHELGNLRQLCNAIKAS